jgi:hypothetical protein
MPTQFASPEHEQSFRTICSELDRLGYKGELLQEDYTFEDWFDARAGSSIKQVTASAAAFGRLPLSDESACFAVAVTNGGASPQPISQYRSLGAPLAFQVLPDRVFLWPVKADLSRARPTPIAPNQIRTVFKEHASDWTPAELLRAKNIAPVKPRQLDFVDLGLLPALEEHIREKLDPLLRSTFFAALSTYKKSRAVEPDAGKLFRLVFRALAGKVLTDRKMPGFRHFATSPNPDELLAAVNSHFGDSSRLIADADTRRAVVDRLWGAFNLKHISAAALSMIWENTLVDPRVRKALGLYGTPPSIARYVVDRIDLSAPPEGERYVVEPCCGSGVFLLAALKRLTALLDPDQYTDRQRHNYLKRMLSGFDIEPFGLEVARDCLMLADFPNSNGWLLEQEDVFEQPARAPKFYDRLGEARFVLCNPPFIPNLTAAEMQRYQAQSPIKPAELLRRVLASAPNLAGVGFVLPHQILTGQSFRVARRQLAERFGTIDLLALPEKGVFSSVRYRAVALVAKDPKLTADSVAVFHRTVAEPDWHRFVTTRKVTREERGRLPVEQTPTSIALPELSEIWSRLDDLPKLPGAIRPLDRRGIQWNKPLVNHRSDLIRNQHAPGYKLGIPSAPKRFFSYLEPPTAYLSVKPKDRYRNAFELPWGEPKVVMNANRKGSQHPWRIAAFADYRGLVAYHTFKGLWPSAGWSPELLAAVLNGPVASAFVTTHETGPEITNEVLDELPVPRWTPELDRRVSDLVRRYATTVQNIRPPAKTPFPAGERLLLEIDAAVLHGYALPPRLERRLLDYFNGFGAKRPVGFPVGDYFPSDFEPTMPLHIYLSTEFQVSTVENLLAVVPTVTDPDLIEALTEVE